MVDGAPRASRLSAEIEYSQPVIYKHFASLDEIADAVALEGFAELAAGLHGLVVLQRGARLRPDLQEARIDLLVEKIVPAGLGGDRRR